MKDADMQNVEYIFAMTKAHRDIVLSIYPELEKKTYILKEFIGILDYVDIDDPWGWDYTVYENCAKEIVAAVDKLLYILTEK
jgi:protein-tyrosine-phosphatase